MFPHEHCITFRHTFYSKVRVDAENGATAGKTELAKELGYDAIHDTVHEIYKNSGYEWQRGLRMVAYYRKKSVSCV